MLDDPKYSDQFILIDKRDIRRELAETGAWDDEELEDDEQNLRRITWMAGNNIVDELADEERT